MIYICKSDIIYWKKKLVKIFAKILNYIINECENKKNA